MKKLTILILTFALACSIVACGCQSSGGMDNTTGTTAPTTAPTTTPATRPMIDPTILDPTFETNIPDGTVNDNSTVPSDTTDGTENNGARKFSK